MRGYRYILFMLALLVSVGMRGQYNPQNPPEPGVYHTLTLQATPADGGSFNVGAVTSCAEGSSVALRAYANSNFRFVAWEEDGYVVSASASYTYTMSAHDARLVARYVYDPTSPAEPPRPDLPEFSSITLTASPADGGYFNIGSGARYEVGSTVNLRAYAYNNFTFVNWTENGEAISSSSSFNYEVKAGDPHLVANFVYSPSSPGEPSEPALYRRLSLQADPAGGGYFNVAGGNAYQAGSLVDLRAYSNQWYTFTCWTLGGDTISTNSQISFTMPDADTTLVAHYSYNYDPSGPGEPGQPAGKVNIYGMTENGVRGQTLAYPVYLENPVPVSGMVVDMQFPAGFAVNTGDIRLAGRASGHSMTVTELGDNAFRFGLTGDAGFSGTNGKVFDVMVTIPDTATMNRNYTVALSHGVMHTADGAQEAVAVRSGYIYVDRLSEDGLYARFSYDKLLNRVQFLNQSSAKAVGCEWDFGDGTTGTEANPLHTYAAPGYYDVTLTARGELGEDVARMTILVNDEQYWTIGGTFMLSSVEDGVRSFTSPDSLLAFIGRASVTEDLALRVDADSTFTLGLNGTNMALLGELQSQMAERSLSLRITASDGTVGAVLALGGEGDALTPEVLELYNSLGRLAVCENVSAMLCGVEYNPAAINSMTGQTVRSGNATHEVDFGAISSDLSFAWTLATAPDPGAVSGYETGGTGSIPSMFIDNIGETDAVLTYNVTGSLGEQVYCRFAVTVTVTPGSAVLDEAEWRTLGQLRDALVDGGWPSPWDMSAGIEQAGTLTGVTVSRGHVVAIDLSGQGLAGAFPTVALTLPRLETLSLADNALGGDVARDILQAMTVYAAGQPGFRSALRSLDISGNGFTGNIGLLASLSGLFPNLAELRAARNGLTDVTPPLPAAVGTLDLTGQRTDSIVAIDVAAPDFEAVAAQLPSLMLYDHVAQGQRAVPMLRLENRRPSGSNGSDDGYWGMDIDLSEGRPALTALTAAPYRGRSGDVLYVSYPCAAPEVERSSCLTVFEFEQGNADFTGGVEATDLQATILYAFDDYEGRPFNFTAANTFADDVINVQDVVCTVNLLLADGTGAATAPRQAPAAAAGGTAGPAARVYLDGGRVMLRSAVPVAALTVRAEGNVQWAISGYGMEQATRGGNLVGYSLAGVTLPAGTTVIGTCAGSVSLISATLSDAAARPVSVAVGPGDITGIDAARADGTATEVYDLSGHRREGLQKGVNIVKRGSEALKVIRK